MSGQTEAQRAEATGLASWAKIRPWSRTDSARWLNDRSAPVLAWLRRRAGHWPAHSAQIGYWLKENQPSMFAGVHTALAALSDEGRERAIPSDLLQ